MTKVMYRRSGLSIMLIMTNSDSISSHCDALMTRVQCTDQKVFLVKLCEQVEGVPIQRHLFSGISTGRFSMLSGC